MQTPNLHTGRGCPEPTAGLVELRHVLVDALRTFQVGQVVSPRDVRDRIDERGLRLHARPELSTVRRRLRRACDPVVYWRGWTIRRLPPMVRSLEHDEPRFEVLASTFTPQTEAELELLDEIADSEASGP